MKRQAALQSLNAAFTRDVVRFVDEAAPAVIDLSACMQEYLGVANEIKRG